MELEQMPQPGPGLYGSDREVFERVWRRVMETGGGESPVEVIPEGAGLPAPFPEVSAPAAPLLLPPDPEDAIRCLGPASSRYGEALQQFIQAELQDAATYRALARRGRSGSRLPPWPARSAATLSGSPPPISSFPACAISLLTGLLRAWRAPI